MGQSRSGLEDSKIVLISPLRQFLLLSKALLLILQHQPFPPFVAANKTKPWNI